MTSKLSDYKKDQLPGGKYWNPTEEVKIFYDNYNPTMTYVKAYLDLTTG